MAIYLKSEFLLILSLPLMKRNPFLRNWANIKIQKEKKKYVPPILKHSSTEKCAHKL